MTRKIIPFGNLLRMLAVKLRAGQAGNETLKSLNIQLDSTHNHLSHKIPVRKLHASEKVNSLVRGKRNPCFQL